ncbi:MAG: hypothetical protein KDC14_04160 [Planctomycetes bacterium]|nr:hypothetical protein [Planctomycetota bacterium]
MNRFLTTLLVAVGLAALALARTTGLARTWLDGGTDLPSLPRASQMVVIENASYTVPQGRRFVLSALGHKSGAIGTMFLFQNGTRLLRVDSTTPGAFVEIPKGLAFAPGTLIEIAWAGSNPSNALYPNVTAWGYLELDH